MNAQPSCNVPITDADLEGIRDGASEAYNPHLMTQDSTSAYWELRLIARIDAERAKLRELVEVTKQLVQARSNARDLSGPIHRITLVLERIEKTPDAKKGEESEP